MTHTLTLGFNFNVKSYGVGVARIVYVSLISMVQFPTF